MAIKEIRVPDIGDFKEVPVIEILVKPGDTVKAEDALVTLESDKASMDVPSPDAGKVVEVKLVVGDKVSQGALILTLETAGAGDAKPAGSASPPVAPAASTPAPQAATHAGGADLTCQTLVLGAGPLSALPIWA
jgi:dihydrolipoamide dehydrogenase